MFKVGLVYFAELPLAQQLRNLILHEWVVSLVGEFGGTATSSQFHILKFIITAPDSTHHNITPDRQLSCISGRPSFLISWLACQSVVHFYLNLYNVGSPILYILRVTQTMLSNPFTQRSFPSSLTSSSISSNTYDRHYFPHMATNTIKPSFLIKSHDTLPTVYGDMRSPYSTLATKQQPRPRTKYLQNPFHKSNLLEDVTTNTAVPYYTSTNYKSPNLKQSRVVPVRSEREDQDLADITRIARFLNDEGPNSKYDLPDRKQRNKQTYEKNNNNIRNNNNYGTSPQINEKVTEIYKDHRINLQQIKKKPSEVFREQQIVGIPSFNSKFNQWRNSNEVNRESLESPRFNTREKLHEEEKPKVTSSQGVQASKFRGNKPESINYQGKTFYFINVDEL